MNGFNRKTQPIRALWLSLLGKRQNLRGGFTLLEAIVTVAMIGIISAIAAPSWLAYLNVQRLNSARSEAVSALSQARTQAIQRHVPYEAGFRQQNQQAQWAIYPVGADPKGQDWKNLNDGVKLLETADTTFAKKDGVYRIQFNHRGEVNGQLGRVTFASVSGGQTKRCVVVSNLLGTVREGENRPQQTGNPCN